MQNALKNPHYKKIWEKVIMNRHPEAKSLEEALEIESKDRLCFITSPQWGYFKDSEGKSYRKDFDDQLFTVGEYEIYSDSHVGGGFATILGRAITLFNVLHLLNKQHLLYVADGTIIYFIDKNAKGTKIFCDFTSNLLEEQTPETWEKIANLID